MIASTIKIEDVREYVDDVIATLNESLRKVNHELAYEEHHAHDTICDFLETQGFTVNQHAYGLDTSFEALSGSDGRLINFNAEYDALPDIGHACGHNLIATSSIAAFLSLSFILKKFQIPGRTQLLGTPAEENGGGKVKLIDAGAYKNVDISLMAHGGPKKIFADQEPSDGIAGTLMNARKKVHCEFTGRSAHAGGNPWDGINALDALVSAYNNVAVLRQQLLPEQRIHCAFMDTPKVANVIPAYTKAFWQVRSPSLKGLNNLALKVRNCIEAGALATGCQVVIKEEELYTEVRLNDTLCERYQIHMGEYGRKVIKRHDKVITASSDIGNVSYVTPTLHTMFGIQTPDNTFPHHPAFTASAGTDEAHAEAVIVGCSTCRRRKVKCGEERPTCSRCLNLRLACEWGVPVKRGRSAQIRHLQHLQHLQPAPGTSETGDSPLKISRKVILNGHSTFSWPGDGVTLETPSTTEFYPPFTHIRNSTPLYPVLGGYEIICANSLTLTEHDQKYFAYFPESSIIHYYMKGWRWSSFNYLYQSPASNNKVIMRMIIALSASDMHRYGLVVRSPGRPTAEDHGRYHYSLAVKEFRQLLETPRRDVSVAELEMIFATMFLMITYEWQFGHSVRHLQLHLDGVRSLLKSHPQLFRLKDVNDAFLAEHYNLLPDEKKPVSKVSFIPEQFLLWTLYIDASCRPMGLTESLYDYVMQSNNPALYPDHLHKCARLWGRCFYGEQYPDQEVLDDIENYRALELLHAGMCMRYQTMKVLMNPRAGPDSKDSIFREIMSTRDRFSDLFITARFAAGVSARRTLNTIYMAVCTFYAQVLLHRRLLCPESLPTSLHRQATTGIVDIASKQFASDPRLLRRLHWALLTAIIETDNTNHRLWLRERLLEFRNYHSEYMWANEIADQILARQDISKGCYVNLAELLLQRLNDVRFVQ
ncbi:hypothetical protein N7495_006574 [Penicillium taxi]|uniref:uncharacterized protein n=1 Tax=Penicillium taxi TaxID=168475 RepID=UPI0025458AD1|nr:uncharacterized protein N7495_006574 [Penicillium taxi]KAJ5894883.1 hypothetical protein N7495_006574 [Penicillium taxi]